MPGLPSSLRAGVAVFALAFATVSMEAPTRAQADLTFPSASLSQSLNALSRSAGVEILADPVLLRGKRAPAVQGAASPDAALTRLLTGSGLGYEKRGSTFLIVPGAEADRATAATPAAPASRAPAEVADNLAEPEPLAGETIIVTGSRIARPELESAMPISIVSMEQSERLGLTTAYDALAREPAIGAGTGPETNATGVGGYDNGIAAVALRNLGTNRTLTLVDGRRRVSGSARSSAVDLNMIPTGMIERIEVITGGAAAIYGADAVTGAINVITKRDVGGLNLNVTNGISDKGDAAKFSISGSAGTTFSDNRGTIAIGGTYTKHKALFAPDRKATRTRLLYVANPENTGAHDGIPDMKMYPNVLNIYYMFEPTFYINGDSYIVQDNGVPRLAQYDTVLSTGLTTGGNGGDGRNFWDNRQLRAPLEALSVTSRFDYDLTDAIKFDARFDYGRTKYNGTRTYYRDDARATFLNGAGGAVAFLDNPYLPDGVRDFMLDNDLTRLNINRAWRQFGEIGEYHDRESYTFSAGLSGDIASNVHWEAFYQYGRTRDDVTITNNPIASHMIAARDVIADPATGQPVCRDAAARADGCLPLNIFGQDALTPEERAYLLHDRREKRTATQAIFGGSLVATPFALPAGDVAIALGVEHRKETLETIDDPLSLNGEVSHTGLEYTVHPNLKADFDVSEVYGELVIPVLKDMPFANNLSVEGAYRYSDYSSVGTTHAWKAGATWSPVRGVTFRTVRSRSVRTPNFGELYEVQNRRGQAVNDPCEVGRFDASPTRAANCRALGIPDPLPLNGEVAYVTSGGNPNLRPETSNSLTAGVVIQPAFLPGFDFTADYWNIKIDDMITQFSANAIANMCVDLPTIDNDFCRLLQFDPQTRYIIEMSTQQMNASRSNTRGIDFAANYRTRAGAGRLSFSFKGTYLLQKDVTTVPGIADSVVVYDGEYPNPRFRGNLHIDYSTERFSLGLDTRYHSGGKYDANVQTDEVYENNSVPSRIYNDLTLQYRVTEKLALTAGVNNMFDVKPPYFPNAYLGLGYYDIVGRYLFTSLKAKF